MIDSIAKCRDPLRSILEDLYTWVTTTYPETVVTEPDSMDREGWIDFAVPLKEGGARTFAGARFRRDKPTAFTIVLAARPAHDAMEWVHVDMGRLRPLGFAFGLPRPFEKGMSEESMRYVYDLVAQSRDALLEGL
ncbi:MAG: hypothetical protein JXA58_00150 [Dehalococcoidia bacterium]|nr:hypothetical protein [Dehalococcoidia bacterium]